jgi:intein/homing endonuclease
MKAGDQGFSSLFEQFRDNIMRIDPVYFCAKYLKVDGSALQLEGTGYKPFADIYRYVGLKAIEPDSKPIVMVKGRQVGATTMAAAIECYFSACGLFGTNERPPMRMMHLFPTLSLAAAYTKDKLDPIIGQSQVVPGLIKSNGMLKSYMESKMDIGSPTNNNMHFKKFMHGNQIWIESTGLDGDRIRGRQLCLDTEFPTPDRGFIKLRDLKEGDKLFDENGEVCSITKMHPIQESPESYRVVFDDGTTIDACAEHLWLTHTRRDRINARKGRAKPKIRNTKELLETLKTQGENNHCIPTCKPVDYDEKELPIDPYLLGLWLGDGGRYGNIETADIEVLESFEHRLVKSSVDHVSNFGISKSRSYRVIGLTTALKNLGLIDNPGKSRRDREDFGFYKKIIPDNYMRGSVEQRLALLQGLMDSDGCCGTDGRCEFVQCESRKELAMQVVELIHSLGIKTSLLKSESYRYSVKYQDRYRIQFWTTLPVFRLERKLKNLKSKLAKANKRFIKDIIPIDPKPMRCISVDSPSRLYLVTRSYIATHNTVDCCMFDECFPYNQLISTNKGKIKIGKLFELFKTNSELPLVLTYNESTESFEYKRITNAWNRGTRKLVQVQLNNRKIKCTPNHPFLTIGGWVNAEDLKPGDLVSTYKIDNPVAKDNGLVNVESVIYLAEECDVYDIEIEDNHNFIACSENEDNSGVIVHNCQDMSGTAIGAVTKILAQSRYGGRGEGVQVFFGTPKTKGGVYWDMWQNSSQNYYHLRCEKCGYYFPLYRPDINWEDVWIYGFTVRCTSCHHEQDKLEAQERGKWIPLNDPNKTDFVGYHFNQLLIPSFTKEVIDKARPDRSPVNTERLFMNEVLGEFYDGEGGTITVNEIRDKCIDKTRKMVKNLYAHPDKRVYAGFDWGQRGALEQLSGKGRKGSYSCAVILTTEGNLFNIEFATRLSRPDPEHKQSTVEEMFRRYNLTLAVGDIGDAYDLTHKLQKVYDEKFLASRSSHKVIGHIKYSNEEWPKTIVFEKDYYISELIGLLKEGRIKFPGGSYDKIEWLIEHCASMDIKVTTDRSGEPMKKFVKGSGANDGMMALLNAYLAWKFDVSQGFTIHNPLYMKYEITEQAKPVQAILGYIPKMFNGRG